MNGDTEEALVRLKAALLTALLPTLVVVAMQTLGFVVRGVTLEPGWLRRAAAAAAIAYVCFVAFILFDTRKTGKG
ncbi:hypothetical protein [Novosphingobium sp.]|uniref:hypothetical protein n=1 Tax=Novosphingobium sp. TaxID=1874826 RepID=UPI00261D3703|nr:hypothetical protein [Novosphingobium sp.]